MHLGTIGYGLREFVVMLGRSNQQIYIEEVVLNNVDFSNDVFASLKHIKDDELFRDLAAFAGEKKLTDIATVIERLFEAGQEAWLMNDLPNLRANS